MHLLKSCLKARWELKQKKSIFGGGKHGVTHLQFWHLGADVGPIWIQSQSGLQRGTLPQKQTSLFFLHKARMKIATQKYNSLINICN